MPAKLITGDVLVNSIGDQTRLPWDLDGLKYINSQQGSGKYSLCRECNNNTGAWYGREYGKVAHTFMQILNSDLDSKDIAIRIEQMHPLQFIKQVVSLFCSVCGSDANIQDLRDFVLNKESTDFPWSKYKLRMFFTKSSLARQYGITAAGIGPLGSMEVRLFSEIVAKPFGFLLYINPDGIQENDTFAGFDITEMAARNYNEVCDVYFPYLIYEVNSKLPLVYTSKEDLMKIRDLEIRN